MGGPASLTAMSYPTDTATPPPSSTPAGPSRSDAATLAADRAAYRRVVSAGFGLWLDYDWRKKGWNTRDLEKNHFSPAGFETSLRAALEQSDEYVWIYTETPRWWSEKGESVALPPAYADAIRRVRTALAGD